MRPDMPNDRLAEFTAYASLQPSGQPIVLRRRHVTELQLAFFGYSMPDDGLRLLGHPIVVLEDMPPPEDT